MNTHSEFLCLHDGNAVDITNAYSNARMPADWFYDALTGGQTSDAGVTVNGYTALTHSAVWQAINVIAGDIGQVLFRLVEDEFNDKNEHPAYRLINLRPNDLQSPSVFKETIAQWMLMWGNFVGWVIRKGATPVDIIPLRPDCLRYELLAFEGQQIVRYHYTSPVNGTELRLLPDDVIHLQGLTSDGVWGYPLFQIGKNTIGHGLALEKHGNKQFSNGALPAGILKTAGRLSPEAKTNLRDEWYKIHGGSANAGKIAVLVEGLEFQQMAMTNIDSQWIEASKENRIHIAGLVGVPPYRIGALDTSSNRANLEEQNENYKQTTLTRHTNKMCEEFGRKLLKVNEYMGGKTKFSPVFNNLGPDIDTKSTVADRLVKATMWSPNEGRAFLGYGPREGGDTYENPAINPEQQGAEAAPKETEKATEGPENKAKHLETALMSLLEDRLAQVFELESRMLKQASEGKLPKEHSGVRNFVEWMDAFYLGNGKAPLLSDLFDMHVAKSMSAAQLSGIKCQKLRENLRIWGLSRRNWLLEACSSVTAKDLPAAVESLTSERPSDVASALLTESVNA